MNYHSEKNKTNEEGELYIYPIENLLSFTAHINDISSEIKALKRSIAILKQDFPKILRDDLKIKGGL